jgi:polyvinyl alcohol dehydrogenase (cytochrome)
LVWFVVCLFACLEASMRNSLIQLLLWVSCAAANHVLAETCQQLPTLTPQASDWAGWGQGQDNDRYTKGLSSRDVGSLQLRWAFAFRGVSSVVGNPVVLGTTVFIGVDSGQVYALNIDTGCVYWTFQAEAGVRTAPALAKIDTRTWVFFGDRNANTYAVDAATGLVRWKEEVDSHPAAILTGSPQFVNLAGQEHPLRLIVPVSSTEEGLAAVPTYTCCTFRGSVVSLDATTGEKLWQSYTIQTPPQATGDKTQGPSGAAIWSAPTIDLAGKRLFVTTGDAYSSPADKATDAVLGMDLLDGHLLWVNQGTANDVWTVACLSPTAPSTCGPDQDYGSPAMLVNANNQAFLVAGQKSGWIRAFNLADGNLLWNTALVDNTEEFGGKVVWGGADDGAAAYFGLGSGGIAAVRISDGKKLWFTELTPNAEQAKHPGQDGPLTISDDLLISGGWDGLLRILSTVDGKVLWQYNTLQPYMGVNGESGNGGSLGAAGPVVSGKHLLVPSGYVGVKNGTPGNVLLMFTP